MKKMITRRNSLPDRRWRFCRCSGLAACGGSSSSTASSAASSTAASSTAAKADGKGLLPELLRPSRIRIGMIGR